MKKIKLTKNKWALVDDEDFDWLNRFSWYVDSYGYAGRRKNGKRVRMHREILQLAPSENIDHKDMNRLNNQRKNLRIANKSQNQANSGIRKNSLSGYKGVYYRNDGGSTGRWIAKIMLKGKNKNLGSFKTAKTAAKAYNQAAKELFGEFARLNPI